MIGLVLMGLFSGIISGMGIGGGTILIPGLTILFGIQQQQAQNINLINFIPVATIAIITHMKNKTIEKKIAIKLIVFGILGAVIGSIIAVNVDSNILRKTFGFFLLIMGISELSKKEKQTSKETAKN